jgi:predicted porin
MNRLSFLFLGFVILFQSCTSSTPDSRTERKVALTDSTSFYAISVEYPMERRDADNVMHDFVMDKFNTKKEEWKTGGEVHLNELKVTAAFPDRANIKYTYDIEFEAFSSKKTNIISYLFTNYEYTGGANGNTTVNTFAFSSDKKLVDIQSILDFENHNDVELTKLLAETALSDTTLFFRDFVYDGLGLSYLKSDGKTLDKEKCDCDGFFFGSNFQNFIVKDSGIVFYFNKYDIAPGAAGVTSVLLTWEQLKPYLRDSFTYVNR